jgi:3D (Asp-Asp-Asp) domain-containing protein
MSPIVALMGLLAFSGASALDSATLQDSAAEVSVTNATEIAVADPKFALATAEEAKTFTVKLTAYNAVPEQTDGDPMTTASGAYSNPELIAARSVDLKADLPWGTVIKVSRAGADSHNCRFSEVESQIGYRVIGDSMHSRKREQIDILLDQNNTVPVYGKEINPALALGLCSDVTIEVVGHIDGVKNFPKTQADLVAMVESSKLARR